MSNDHEESADNRKSIIEDGESTVEDGTAAAEKGVHPGNVYINETHGAILADIVGHPYQLPTLPELVYTNRKHDKARLKRSLQELIKEGLIEEIRFEDGSPHPRHPELFFGITEYGRRVLFNRIPEKNEPKLQAAYAQATKPDDIQRFERAPRPPRPDHGPGRHPNEGADEEPEQSSTEGSNEGPDEGSPEFGGGSEDLLDDLSDDSE